LSGRTIVLQDALLGISAHINYDLAFAVRDVEIDPNRPSKRQDHDAINAILRRRIDDAQAALAEIYGSAVTERFDALLGRGDEAVAYIGLVGSRDLAWRNAVLLTDAWFPALRCLVRWRIRAVATGVGQLILAVPIARDASGFLANATETTEPLQQFRDTFFKRTGLSNSES